MDSFAKPDDRVSYVRSPEDPLGDPCMTSKLGSEQDPRCFDAQVELTRADARHRGSGSRGYTETRRERSVPLTYDRLVAYQPAPIGEEIPPSAVALAEQGLESRLVVYAGAGLSTAEPTGLPSGPKVAERLYDRLSPMFPSIRACPQNDLTAIADAVAALPSGKDALQSTVVHVAEFTRATPGYSHRVLALLMLEGVVDVLTTNWDNCIERGGGERISAVVTQHDLLNMAPKSVLKIDGCATQPRSLLMTSVDLTNPPAWVTDETRARLGNSVVVFVGIGDIAGYVRKRLEEAIANLGSVNNVRLVDPSIANWMGSEWSNLVGNLDIRHRFAQTADRFFDRLAAAYVMLQLGDIAAQLVDEPAMAALLAATTSGLMKYDALKVLEWLRRAAVVPKPGRAVLQDRAAAEGLLALGRLLGEDFTIEQDDLIVSPNGQYQLLVAVGVQPTSRSCVGRLKTSSKITSVGVFGRSKRRPSSRQVGLTGRRAEPAYPAILLITEMSSIW